MRKKSGNGVSAWRDWFWTITTWTFRRRRGTIFWCLQAVDVCSVVGGPSCFLLEWVSIKDCAILSCPSCQLLSARSSTVSYRIIYYRHIIGHFGDLSTTHRLIDSPDWLKVRSHRMRCVALRCVPVRRLAVCGKNDATCRMCRTATHRVLCERTLKFVNINATSPDSQQDESQMKSNDWYKITNGIIGAFLCLRQPTVSATAALCFRAVRPSVRLVTTISHEWLRILDETYME